MAAAIAIKVGSVVDTLSTDASCIRKANIDNQAMIAKMAYQLPLARRLFYNECRILKRLYTMWLQRENQEVKTCLHQEPLECVCCNSNFRDFSTSVCMCACCVHIMQLALLEHKTLFFMPLCHIVEQPLCQTLSFIRSGGSDLFEYYIIQKTNFPTVLTRVNSLKKHLYQILKAICKLHSFGIAHNDIKPENVVLTENGDDIALIDFGCAIVYRPDGDYDVNNADHKNKSHWLDRLACGSRMYSLNEVINTLPFRATENDFYSFGIMCFSLFTQQQIMSHMWPKQIQNHTRTLFRNGTWKTEMCLTDSVKNYPDFEAWQSFVTLMCRDSISYANKRNESLNHSFFNTVRMNAE